MLAITDQGNLKPIEAVTLHIPGEDKSGDSDLSVTLATDDKDGVMTARAHLSRALADRAELHLVTHSFPDGKGRRSDRTTYFHAIPLRDHLKR